ncbi:MAG: hypothetical protein ACKOEO_11340 [Planctomycetaceae bacterium]
MITVSVLINSIGQRVLVALLMLSVLPQLSLASAADATADAIALLQAARPGGVGSVENQRAAAVLVQQGEAAVLPILQGFRKASPVGENWLRNAFEQIDSDLTAAKNTISPKVLEGFIADVVNAPAARRLAYESLRRQDPAAEARLIPGLLLDPSPEFRRDAVALLVKEAAAAEGPAAIALYRKAFSGAVHEDQVKQISEALRKAGETVDISRHFGFVSSWMIAGPFDNREEKGFAIAYAPEAEITAAGPDLGREYDGMDAKKVRWQAIETGDDFGVVDIAKQIENYKGSAMYASAVWNSSAAQTLQVRLGTPNAWKLWINGKLVFEREEYHRSSQMDQYAVPISLQAGRNIIALKICQNEQTQDWAQKYQYQLRICDTTGAGVLPVTAAAATQTSGEVK